MSEHFHCQITRFDSECTFPNARYLILPLWWSHKSLQFPFEHLHSIIFRLSRLDLTGRTLWRQKNSEMFIVHNHQFPPKITNVYQKSLKSSFEPISQFPDLTAQSLDKKDLFSESDPFYIVYRTNPDGTETLVIIFDVWWHVLCLLLCGAFTFNEVFLLSSTTVSVCCAPKKVK